MGDFLQHEYDKTYAAQAKERRAKAWQRRKPYLIKGLKIITMLIIAALFVAYVVPSFFNTLMDRLERQRIAEHAYYCQHYGAEMNKHAGRDVCP